MLPDSPVLIDFFDAKVCHVHKVEEGKFYCNLQKNVGDDDKGNDIYRVFSCRTSRDYSGLLGTVRDFVGKLDVSKTTEGRHYFVVYDLMTVEEYNSQEE